MEEAIEQIVSYFKHAAQGLEEKKQILYLLGPVGGGKSSLADRLKILMEKMPIYAIKDSPVFESPLGLFDVNEDAAILDQDFGISKRHLNKIMSPWAAKRLLEFSHRSSTRSRSQKPSQVMKTTRIFQRWLVRSISACWSIMRKMMPMPIVILEHCVAPTRV
jgi:predicted Ser/Thr protein kinase